MRYNDCVWLTKSYLKNFSYYRQAVKNLETDIADLEQELLSSGAKIASYGPSVGGASGGALNGTEHGAERRMEIEQEILVKRSELGKLRGQLLKLKSALNLLPDDERTVIRLYYIDRLSYALITQQIHFSERWIRNKLGSGVRSVAIMLFGARADASLCFIHSA